MSDLKNEKGQESKYVDYSRRLYIFFFIATIFSFVFTVLTNSFDFNGKSYSAIFSVLIFMFGNIKSSIIDRFIFTLKWITEREEAALKFILMSMCNLPLATTVFYAFLELIGSGIPSMLFTIFIMSLFSYAKWILKYLDDNLLLVDPWRLLRDKKVTINDRVVSEYISKLENNVGKTHTDEFQKDLCEYNASVKSIRGLDSPLSSSEVENYKKEYKGHVYIENRYGFEHRVTSDGIDYYMVKSIGDSYYPRNFNDIQWDEVMKYNNELRRSYPVFYYNYENSEIEIPANDYNQNKDIFKRASVEFRESFDKIENSLDAFKETLWIKISRRV